MIDESNDRRGARPQEKWASYSAEQLKAERLEALKRLEKAEVELAEARHLAEIYGQAGEQLLEKAKRTASSSEGNSADGESGEARELETLAEENFKKADTNGLLAKAKEQQVFEAKSLAMSLVSQIKKKNESKWDDWEL